MKFLHIAAVRKSQGSEGLEGSEDSGRRRSRQACFREKLFKYGDVVGHEYISPKKRFLVISGKTSSGKTRYLAKLHQSAEAVWGSQLRPYSRTKNMRALASRDDRPVFKSRVEALAWSFPAPVFISVVSEQAQWLEHAHVAQWWDQRSDEPFKKLKTFQKRAAIVDYLRETRAMLFVDDLDKVPPRKLQFFKDMLNAASRSVITTTTLGQISQPLRLVIDRDELWMQHIELTTDASFDATHLVMLLVVAICAVSGQWAVAAFASTVYALISRGKFTTKF